MMMLLLSVGGADKIATFISLMRRNELSTVCLLDHIYGSKAEAQIKTHGWADCADKKIIFYHTVIRQTFADIEDLFTKRRISVPI